MITIKNTQRTIPVNTDALQTDTQRILDFLGYADFDIGIWVTTDKTIRGYNKQYRSKDKATDILSFPFWPHLKAGERIKPKNNEEKNLGDLIISAPYVEREALKYGVSFDERVRVLLVHGICHLLGYDHERDDDYETMRTQEKKILAHLK